MQVKRSFFALAAMGLFAAAPAYAQQPDTTKPPVPAEKPTAEAPKPIDTQPEITIQRLRPVDKRGINVFEAAKNDGVPYEGFKLSFGGAFTQQFQGLDHENTAAERLVNNVNANQLMKIGNGFNNAVANLYINAQLAPGIRVAMTSYLSSRHHQEAWVKDGYLLVDESPINIAPLKKVMEYVTLRIGHFELNYGDAHFRRTDNGNAMYNPFVGNYIMDAYTTEIGGEVYFRTGPWLAMVGATGGEIRGQVTVPEKRGTSYLGKLGFDRKFSDDLRVRLTGSSYVAAKANSNTLFTGDRAGSRYYFAMENSAATEKDQAWSGAIRPGFSNEVRTFVFNPFVKFHGFEYFGNIESASGRASTEPERREWNQHVGEFVYRFLADERLYLGARFNEAKGDLKDIPNQVQVERAQFGGGWFLTPSILLKGEYVTQTYKGFPTTDIRSGGKFKGFMIEGVVAF
jgi:hypothetical protein